MAKLLLQWTPQAVGDYPVTFTVTDGGNGGLDTPASDWVSIVIAVRNSNNSPVLPFVPDQTVDEAQLLEFSLNATDPDGDALTYRAENLPDGATLDPATGIFSWTPGMHQAGLYEDIEVLVTDGHRSRFDRFNIEVANVNRAPQIVPQAPLFWREAQQFSIDIEAGDADGDPLVFSVAGLPSGALFNESTGILVWTPDYEQAGDHQLTFTVTDPDGLSDSTDVTLRSTTSIDRRLLTPLIMLSNWAMNCDS